MRFPILPELESIALAPWASRRRQDLLDLLDQLTPKIQELTRALEQEVEKRAVTRRLMTHPGVGPLTALAFGLVNPGRSVCLFSLVIVVSRGKATTTFSLFMMCGLPLHSAARLWKFCHIRRSGTKEFRCLYLCANWSTVGGV